MNKKEADIVFLISHGFTSRGLFQTNLVQQMVQRGHKVAIICKEKETQLVENCKNAGADLYEYKIPYGRIQYHFERSRKYFLEDIRSNPVLWEKHIIRIKSKEGKKLKNRIINNIYYLIYLIFNTFKFLRKIYQRIEEQFLKDKNASDLLKQLNPTLIVSTRPPDPTEAFILVAAKQLKIPKIFSILSWDNISNKGVLPVLAEEYLTWGKIMGNELKQYYKVQEDKITESGVPHFDIHHEVVNETRGLTIKDYFDLDDTKPFLFFAMSAPVYSPHEIDIVTWIAERINEGYWGENLQFVVRPHIQNMKGRLVEESWIERLRKLKSEKVAIDFPKDNDSILTWSMRKENQKKLSRLIANSTITMSSGSTVSIEGVILDRPSIIASFDGGFEKPWWQSAERLITFPHLATAVSYDGISIAKSYEDLDNMIKEYIKNPTYKEVERRKLRQAEVGLFDGKATERAIEAYEKFIRKYQKT